MLVNLSNFCGVFHAVHCCSNAVLLVSDTHEAENPSVPIGYHVKLAKVTEIDYKTAHKIILR